MYKNVTALILANTDASVYKTEAVAAMQECCVVLSAGIFNPCSFFLITHMYFNFF
jgi:hypothetical protein